MSTMVRITLAVVTLTLAACDRGGDPVDPGDPAFARATEQQNDKIGAAVLEALERGENPAIMIALEVGATSDLAVLRRAVSSAQDGVLRRVAGRELAVRRSYTSVPALAAVAHSREGLERMAADPRVRRIDLDLGGTGSLATSVPLINADHRHASGNRGAGVVVAILDTGMDTDHPDLADALVHEACFGDNNNSIDGAGFCPGGSDRRTGAGAAEDDAGHGTHVSGIVASNGTVSSVGMAPDADLVAIKVLDNCTFSGCFQATSEITAALDYIITNSQLGVQVINMSLGTNALFTGDCDNASAPAMVMAAAVNTLRTNGVITFASAGNNSSSTQMTLPACLSNVISVGATDNNDAIANFSNISTTTDILAPGVGILSLARGGGTTTAGGTSMASPHAAGCAALLIEAGDAATPNAIETRLETSTVQVTDTRNSLTLPRIDCTPDDNQAPTIAVDNASVTVNEGSAATNSGTFEDAEDHTVTLSASVGTVTPGNGTWSWSFNTTDGPAQSQTVTITATDELGASSNVTFSLVVQNVAPAVNAGADANIVSNMTFNFSGTFSDPGVIDFPWNWTIAWGDGTQTSGSTNSQAAAITASKQFCAAQNYTVRLTVTDKDGHSGFDELTLSVAYVPVSIDITPREHPNSLSLSKGGLLPVAVLSTATFDATTLDPTKVTLGDETGTDTPVAVRNNGSLYASIEDVNRDGRPDLVLHFGVPALIANGDVHTGTTSLVLRGFLADGCTNVRGTDSVRIVP